MDDDLLSGHYGENIVCPYCGESSKDMIIYEMARHGCKGCILSQHQSLRKRKPFTK